MIFVSVFIVLVTVLVAVMLYKRHAPRFQGGKKKLESTIPGLEPADPESGNLSDIATAGSLHEFLVKKHREYGPIVSFWFGQRYTVSVASPEILKDLKNVFNRPAELFQLFAPLIGDTSIQYTNHQEGRLRRKTTDHCWSHEMLRHFCENFNELGEEMVANLSSLPERDHVPLCQHTMALTIKGLSQTSLGDYFKDDAKCHFLKHNYEICWHEMQTRLDGHIPEPGSERDMKFNEGLENMKSLVREIIRLRTENPPKPHERAFIDVLMDNPEIYPEPKLLSDVMSYMVGGFHTSGYLMAWTLYFLAKDQDVQEKVYQEIMTIVGPRETIAPEDISKFVYMRRVIDESLRLSILAPWAAKVQDADVYLGGHFVPKGTPVITALGVLLQDEKLWPNPEKFDPDRFSPENAKGRHPLAFLPFGLPGRICPGYRFAFYELTVFMAILIRSFKWTLVEGQMVQPVHGLVTQPKDEIWVQLEPRQ